MKKKEMRRYPYQFTVDGDGCIQAEQAKIKDLLAEYGSPLNIISHTQLIHNLGTLKETFAHYWEGPVRVLPAIKCNTSLALCHALAAETEGCDLFSEGELITALEAGYNPAYLSLNGNSKLTTDMVFLEKAIQQGVRITLDDKVEFEAIESIAKKLETKARIRFRVRPMFPKMNEPSDFMPDVPCPAELATFAYKAGIPTEDLVQLGPKALKSEHVELTGLHLHMGRHCQGMGFWKAGMEGYARLIADLKNRWNGWEPGEIDIGGGFSQQFDPMMDLVKKKQNENKEYAWLSRLIKIASIFGETARYKMIDSLIRMFHANTRKTSKFDLTEFSSPALEEYGQVAGFLKTALEKRGIDTGRIVLELEPGRAIFGGAAIHVCRVSFLKQQTVPFPWAWAVTDTTEYFLMGGGHGANHPYAVDGKPLGDYTASRRLVADIVGKSCGPDRIIGDSCLPNDIEPGDLIAFIGTGAYQEMQSPNFNSMGRPATVLVRGDKTGLIRRRETTADVLSREMVPDWLGPANSTIN
ncbi:MAG: hypothetical protein GY846_09310 [Deltaproteobacteria bacterium]|nr:hypothetical protein [Deltaproteobacteria bacterium]